MIVLDEQISNQQMIEAIGGWYRGKTATIAQLRPGTVILDDAIPALLRKESQAAFLTVNVNDFWRKVKIDHRFCVICFAGDDVYRFPALLKALFRKPQFKNRKQRAGHVFRITPDGTTQFYHCNNREIRRFQL
ncbi:MAG TPA: hypothetical protein VMC85_17335 [Desulfomonilaceae bacterium]|nr:hypothetical protein [Desulfomonilaceae bacterium]